MYIAAFFENIAEGAKAKGIPLREALEQVRDAGMEKIYIGTGSIESMGEPLFQLLEEMQLPVEGLHGWCNCKEQPDDGKYKDFVDYAVRCGAPNILIVPGMITPEEEDRREEILQNMKVAMTKAVAYGKEKGIIVSMENFDGMTAPYNSVQGLNWFMQEVDGLQCSFDTGNFVVYHEDELQALEVFLDKICTLHVKDRSKTRLQENDRAFTCADGVELFSAPVGSGFMQIKEIINRLKETGYDGGLIAELYGCDAENMLDRILQSVRWLKENI